MAEVGTAAKRLPEPSLSPRNRPRHPVDLPYTLHPPQCVRKPRGKWIARKLRGTFRLYVPRVALRSTLGCHGTTPLG